MVLRTLSRHKGWFPGEEQVAAAPSTEGHTMACDVTVPPERRGATEGRTSGVHTPSLP